MVRAAEIEIEQLHNKVLVATLYIINVQPRLESNDYKVQPSHTDNAASARFVALKRLWTKTGDQIDLVL